MSISNVHATLSCDRCRRGISLFGSSFPSIRRQACCAGWDVSTGRDLCRECYQLLRTKRQARHD